MKVTIEIKEINLKAVDLYQKNSHIKNGIYLNTDETGLKMYVAVLIEDGMVLCIGNYSQFKAIFETNLKPDIIETDFNELEPLEEIEQVVSKSFALKMVAIVLNKEKFNDLG